jgi:hypothetical protein
MARPRGRPPKEEESEDVSVKIDRKLAGKAKRIAEHRGETISAVLSPMLEAPLAKAWLQMIREEESVANQ